MIDGVLLFMGLNLIFGATLAQLKGGSYHRARQFMGLAFIVSPITAFIFYALDLPNCGNPYLATAVNLTDYYAIAILMNLSFLTVIGHNRRQLQIAFTLLNSSFALYLIPVWLPIIFGNTEWILRGHIIANIMIGLCCCCTVIFIHHTYRGALKRLDDYYSDEVKSHISWVVKSLYLFIILGVIATISPFSHHYPKLLSALYLVCQLTVYVYMFGGIRRYEMSALAQSLSAIVEDEEAEAEEGAARGATISNETMQSLQTGLEKWIKSRGYTVQGVTLKSVSAEICTNRTYLSSYINAAYSCSFKTWITRLRIEEAKKMLCDSREHSITTIATRVGFASASSFIHIFVNIEGLSPVKWREEHRRGSANS